MLDHFAKIRSNQRAKSSSRPPPLAKYTSFPPPRSPPIAQIASKTATTYRNCETRVMQATEQGERMDAGITIN